MKCKKHLNDYTSEIGVCASCLRERLFSLISAQASEERKVSEAQQPPPVIFHRSVSPYACRRNSNAGNWNRNGKLHHSMSEQQFLSTPQVWSSTGDVVNDGDGMKKKKSRFSVFSKLFRSKSAKGRMDVTITVSNPGDSYATSSSSPSWFATMLSTNRKKKSRLFSFPKSTSRASNSHTKNGYQDRGPNAWDDEDSYERASGYSSESSYGYKMTSRKASESSRGSGAGRRSSHSRNVSGITYSTTPLVKASPSGQFNQKGIPIEKTNSSGDVRFPAKTQLSNASSMSSNQSRRLSDFGRFNQNH